MDMKVFLSTLTMILTKFIPKSAYILVFKELLLALQKVAKQTDNEIDDLLISNLVRYYFNAFNITNENNEVNND